MAAHAVIFPFFKHATFPKMKYLKYIKLRQTHEHLMETPQIDDTQLQYRPNITLEVGGHTMENFLEASNLESVPLVV